MTKIGRNQLCPVCGSGRKFKHCCGAVVPPAVTPVLQPHVLAAIRQHEQREALRRTSYGLGRPVPTATFNGHRVIASGNTVMWSSNWKTFHDFLLNFLKQTLGGAWGNAEIAKPFAERHPILQWYQYLCELQRRTGIPEGGIQTGIMTGPVRAYLSIAWDLFTVRHNAELQTALIKRLKVKDQFHGARHELFVIASFLRAGFVVEFENERDGTSTHHEFTARHSEHSEAFSVEAKARHRPGVMGFAGTPEPLGSLRADVGRHIRKALIKRALHPRMVFVDVNMPPIPHGALVPPWLTDVTAELETLEGRQPGAEPFPPAFVFFTSHPHHFVGPDDPAPPSVTAFRAYKMPEFDDDHSTTLAKHPAVGRLLRSLATHTDIPHEFFE